MGTEDILKSLGKFLYRDYFYFVSGVIIFLSAINSFDLNVFIPNEFRIVVIWASIGLLVSIGFINQEIWSQTPLVKTNCPTMYHSICHAIYIRHAGRPWQSGGNRAHAGLMDDQQYQRIVNLKQICTSIGSSLLTSIIFLVTSYFMYGNLGSLLTAILLIPGAIVFVAGSWLHNMTQSAFPRAESGNSGDD